LLGRTANG